MVKPNPNNKYHLLFEPPIIFDTIDHICHKLNCAISTFKNADISLNGGGKNIVYVSSTHPMADRSKYFKEEVIENDITYIVYKIFEYDNTISEYYTHNNQIHRIGLPAYYSTQEQIKEFAYFNNDKLNRIDGPAVTYEDEYQKSFCAYWIDGIEYTKEEYNKKSRKYKLNKLNKLNEIITLHKL
jgi:hypothetical protein